MSVLPIETWRKIIQYHPFHFYGLSNSSIAPVSQCNDLVNKFSWQSQDAAGRDDIQRAIDAAEDKLKQYFRYNVGLHFVEETIPWPQLYQTGVRYRSNRAVDTRWMTCILGEGKLHSIGKETLTLIGSVTLAYTDADGDGLNDTFTGTTAATTTETDINNIDIYFAAADRLDGDSAGETWKIEPLKKTINANGTVTVLGRSWMLVKPILYEGLSATQSNPLNPATGTNFVTTLEVYQHKADPNGTGLDNSQAVLEWETLPYPSFSQCCGSNVTFTSSQSDPASVYRAIARAGMRDAEIGEVNPAAAAYDSINAVWAAIVWGVCQPPDRVTVRYRAGVLPQSNGEMNREMQTIVARMAAAEMTTRPTACDMANRELYRWQFDLARAAGNNDEQYRISNEDLNNPFGTRAGQVHAWKAVKKQANVLGITV